ncbi:oxysterol-binding protein-related protein 2-like isoform X1 [Acipenser oxyrinchus oxyrinchus]|uniref:Oxysterol-binding protein n=1 Tax=Acipenser oxyrinchus oxyrinchus TaxID=40147 RepID=A0AAD8FW67_ACIOX|nr:oxysterol-binding protein-related protein 2-like isoform X1 [Acipenser oxyrinchus oxyrinchus]
MNNEDEFYDAVTGLESDESYEGSAEMSSKVASTIVNDSNSAKQKTNGSQPQENGIRKRRTTLPAPMFSRSDFSVWSILKKCIGLELSKITMPIVFNEPLSFLQRISEYMEPTYLIHKANSLADSVERMQVVAAFAVSAVASQWERTGKPFNPLLGETYELARDDQGFRLVSEQVSHHPPVSAFYAEGLNNDFIFQGSIYPKLKFWGKSVEAEPRGTITLELLKHNEAYTWTNPSCCVHNVIIGKLWIEQYGTVEIINHSTGDKCVLNFKPCGMFGKELHRVEGYIQDKNKKKLCMIYGKWTECMWSVDPSTYDSFKKSEKKWVEPRKPKHNDDSDRSENDEADDMPEVQETVQVVPGSKLLWRVASRPPDSTQMYNFTNFAVTLNEMDPELIGVLAPTDCRFRPDIRAMENGDMALASREKERLEEKQRGARKERAKNEDEWKTRWFQLSTNPHTGTPDWIFTREYFDRKYADCPDIY